LAETERERERERDEVLTTVKISLLIFWGVTPCGLTGRYQRFGETFSMKMAAVYFFETLVSTN
jgi:hypothetical protein